MMQYLALCETCQNPYSMSVMPHSCCENLSNLIYSLWWETFVLVDFSRDFHDRHSVGSMTFSLQSLDLLAH